MTLWNRLTNRLFSGESPRRKSCSAKHSQRQRGTSLSVESLEAREVMSADPVLMVIANQDFYYQEYNDTRASIEAAGLEVVVAAATTETATPHANSGQGLSDGHVLPTEALATVDADDYSAIVFIGGWGSSQYQYSFSGGYHNDYYDGDLGTKQIANDLINEFLDDGKQVAGICHGVTVLVWADAADGTSVVDGREIVVPHVGSPGVYYEGVNYANGVLSQYEQAVASGATANAVSGQHGDPTTAADDVIVDGQIITAENWDSAAMFGSVVAAEVIASAQPDPGPGPQIEGPTDLVAPGWNDPGDEGLVIGLTASPDSDEARHSLEAAGLEVVVAAATTETATPPQCSCLDEQVVETLFAGFESAEVKKPEVIYNPADDFKPPPHPASASDFEDALDKLFSGVGVQLERSL